MTSFLQDNPFRRSTPVKVAPRSQSVRRDYLRIPTCLMRMPFLANDLSTDQAFIRTRENKRLVEMTARSTNKNHGRATLDDLSILIHVIGKAARLNDDGYDAAHIRLNPAEFLRDPLNASGADGEAEMIEGLRRLHSTRIEMRTGGPSAVTTAFRLFEIGALPDGSGYHVTLPDFLLEEIRTRRILKVLPEQRALRGMRARLFGWYRSWIGRIEGECQLIGKAQAIARAGFSANPELGWEQITRTVEANDLPGLDLGILEIEGDEYVAIPKRARGFQPDEAVDWERRLSPPVPAPSELFTVHLDADDEPDAEIDLAGIYLALSNGTG